MTESASLCIFAFYFCIELRFAEVLDLSASIKHFKSRQGQSTNNIEQTETQIHLLGMNPSRHQVHLQKWGRDENNHKKFAREFLS